LRLTFLGSVTSAVATVMSISAATGYFLSWLWANPVPRTLCFSSR
jgi:hypothetical protein